MGFADVSLVPPLVQVVQELGFTELTPIQAESIPVSPAQLLFPA
jgi:superfamily II DNA/RNA helicase